MKRVDNGIYQFKNGSAIKQESTCNKSGYSYKIFNKSGNFVEVKDTLKQVQKYFSK
jgi:hypothetical protein